MFNRTLKTREGLVDDCVERNIYFHYLTKNSYFVTLLVNDDPRRAEAAYDKL
jgi:hypothetical protein